MISPSMSTSAASAPVEVITVPFLMSVVMGAPRESGMTVQSMDRMVSTSAATPSSISASVTFSIGVMRMTLP